MAPLLSRLGNGGGTTAGFGFGRRKLGRSASTLGRSSSNPAASAKAILTDDPTSPSGPYWITVGGVATELYCDMTTDGGGFMLCGKYNVTGGSNTGSSNVSNLNNLTATSNATHKLSDTNIKALAATSSLYEWSPRTPSGSSPTTIYIMRYSAANWNTWASDGATNMAYESKSSGGTFVGGFNGHFNNRGFSTYSDNGDKACDTVFSGPAAYLHSLHSQFGGTSDFFLWIR
jgi:hypothetical protein